ncbi:MAG TPA: translation initiation factor IF-2 N-terminal domain-containing protein, partial [Trichocoleus sp.]
MNSGKVRIYELSRELNLENKDILAICDRLNVAVKSHSSTITEDEAEQIRTAAKQARTSSGTNGASKPRPTLNPKNGGQPVVHKQQILEIRRHRPPVKPNRPPEAPAAEAPERPNPPQEQPAVRPVASGGLVRPPVRRAETPVARESQEIEAPPSIPESPEPQQAPVAEAQAPRPVASAPAATPRPSKPRPELVGPPSRPSRPARDGAASPSRPVIKQGSDAPTEERESRILEVRRPVPIREVDEQDTTPVLKPKPRLRRDRTEGETTEPAARQTQADVGGGMPIGVEGDLGDSLRRPSPPRHKRKEREDEDDDQEMRKTGKTTKAKRRGPLLDDEDEDFEEIIDGDDELSGSDPSSLSVSLARPPKPKKQGGTAKPTAPTVRSHKPSGRENARARRERREQANKQERPELLVLTEGLT